MVGHYTTNIGIAFLASVNAAVFILKLDVYQDKLSSHRCIVDTEVY